jgi:hypothetical protein
VVDRLSTAAAIFCRDRLLAFEEQPASRLCVIRLTTGKQRWEFSEKLLKIVLARKVRRLQSDERL